MIKEKDKNLFKKTIIYQQITHAGCQMKLYIHATISKNFIY